MNIFSAQNDSRTSFDVLPGSFKHLEGGVARKSKIDFNPVLVRAETYILLLAIWEAVSISWFFKLEHLTGLPRLVTVDVLQICW